MIIKELELPGVFLVEPKRFGDSRGYFMETFKKAVFEAAAGVVEFVQENESKSSYGVVRGLHFQKGGYVQAKLVRAVAGRVLDVVVDIRKSSPTFGKYIAVELSEDNALQLFVPRGCAHGFAVLSPEAVFSYKVDNVYAPQEEISLLYNDPVLGIDWQIEPSKMNLSAKDIAGVTFENIPYFE